MPEEDGEHLDFKLPSVETYFPRAKIHPESFRTTVFVKPAEDAEPCHKVRLIWGCPKEAWDTEAGRCENAVKLHKLIREEASPEECPSSTTSSSASEEEVKKLSKKIDHLESSLESIKDLLEQKSSSGGRGEGRSKKKRKYDCKTILEKSPCKLEPVEKRGFVMCYAQKSLREGKAENMSQGMKKGWEEVRQCEKTS